LNQPADFNLGYKYLICNITDSQYPYLYLKMMQKLSFCCNHRELNQQAILHVNSIGVYN